jgi:sugar lactone lactonase YvrE
MAHRRFAAVAGALVLSGAAVLSAAVPSFWQVATQADFLKGEVENLSIDAHGRLMLGPSSTPVYESSAPFLWTVVTGPDGAMYVGSGNEGQVFRVDASGKGSVFFDAEELEVHALAMAPNGALYVGTSPDGKIYRVEASGKSTEFFDPADKYIWSLAVDKTGSVYAATGDKGVVYKIAPDGKGMPLYQTRATHAISLAFDREGRLLVGTESPGRVFQVDASGKPFVLLDSPFNEIHALRVDANGNIYAAALSGKPTPDSREPARITPEPTPPPAVPSVSTEITAIAIADVSVSSSATSTQNTRSAPGSSAGAIYRILPDGAWDQVWESREDAPYDIGFEPDGSLLVATGGKGKIYRLNGDPLQATLVTRATAQQVTTVMRDRSGSMVYTTANPGKVFRLAPTRAERGTYDSDVRDATTVATWGAIKWHAATPGGSKVEIFTRSGNTRTPDDTWSDWSAAYTSPDGSPIASPRARYLQWRAVLTAPRGESPLLTSVTAAYLQRNLRPRVTSITIHPPGTVFQKPFSTGELEIAGYDGDLPDRRLTAQPSPAGVPSTSSTQSPALGRRVYQKGLMTFVWRAEDDNNDELQYDVLYRREGETAWKALKRGLSDPILVWDTTSVPNGTYLLRVVAADSSANPPGTALTGHMDSASFDIDNAPPTIAIASARRDGGRTIIAFEVRDEHSAVQKVEYSLDGDRWRPIYPKDGISDSRLEQFELVLDGDAGSRGVVIRATDALNNVSSARGEAAPARTQP